MPIRTMSQSAVWKAERVACGRRREKASSDTVRTTECDSPLSSLVGPASRGKEWAASVTGRD
jgi:hypothetical protein